MRRALSALSALLATLLLIAGCVLAGPSQAATSENLFGSSVPAVIADPDASAVELGVQFKPAVAGKVTGVRFYKGTGNTGTHSGSIWSSTGTKLATKNFSGESATGWQTVTFTTPVNVTAGSTYTASYFAPRGHYAVSNPFAWPKTSGNLTGVKGVYRYGSTSGFPTSSYQTSNYWVDVTFSADVTAPPSTTTPTTTPPVTTTPSPAVSPGWTVGSSNVGLAGLGLTCDQLPAYTGPDVPAAGTVFHRQRITYPLNLKAGNITISQSCIQPTYTLRGLPIIGTYNYDNWTPAPSAVAIRDSEIDGSKLVQFDAAWSTAFMGLADLQRNYIHGFGSGIAILASGQQLSATVEGNYVTDLIAWGNPATDGNHSDAFTVRGFNASANPARTLSIRNNRFDCDSDNATGALFVQTNTDDIDNVTIEGNFLEGGGYQLALEAQNGHTYSNVKAINNRFSGTSFGATYRIGGPGWAQWTDNYINDPAAIDNKGIVVAQP